MIRIRQKIKLGGRNWGDVFKLPCVNELKKNSGRVHIFLEPTLTIRPWQQAFISAVKNTERKMSLINANIRATHAVSGDTLVEFDNGLWAIEHDGELPPYITFNEEYQI